MATRVVEGLPHHFQNIRPEGRTLNYPTCAHLTLLRRPQSRRRRTEINRPVRHAQQTEIVDDFSRKLTNENPTSGGLVGFQNMNARTP
jgi:5-methylcytosine-specific restriction endonuclease McrA